MLALDPRNRISVAEALKHPYLKELHDPKSETTCEKFDIGFEYESAINTKFGVRHMMVEELRNFKNRREKKKRQARSQREHRKRESSHKDRPKKQPSKS